MSGHVYTPSYLTAGRSWSRLGPEVQKALEEVAKEMQPVALKLGADADEELLGKLKAAGMQVNEVDKDAFVKASQPVYDEFAREVPEGKALIDRAQSLAKGS
jgi:TRAP-type C4-dicarboxylate transport system substrate-binding protein